MKAKSKIRIMLFGTFDGLHKGHLDFFKQARKLSSAPFLVVSVARDVNVKKIKKQKPLLNEKQRKANVAKSALVDKAVLGGVKNYIAHIVKERPDIIALGYDQKAYVKNLKVLLAKKGVSVKVLRLKAFKPKTYKTSLIRGKI